MNNEDLLNKALDLFSKAFSLTPEEILEVLIDGLAQKYKGVLPQEFKQLLSHKIKLRSNGMKILLIYTFQAKNIEDTLRTASNVLESKMRETCLDRDIMWSLETIRNVLKDELDTMVKRV